MLNRLGHEANPLAQVAGFVAFQRVRRGRHRERGNPLNHHSFRAECLRESVCLKGYAVAVRARAPASSRLASFLVEVEFRGKMALLDVPRELVSNPVEELDVLGRIHLLNRFEL